MKLVKNYKRCYYLDHEYKKTHIETTFYRGGRVSQRVMYKDGIKHGESIQYDYETQNIKSHWVYKNGVPYRRYEKLSEIDRFELTLKYGIEWIKDIRSYGLEKDLIEHYGRKIDPSIVEENKLKPFESLKIEEQFELLGVMEWTDPVRGYHRYYITEAILNEFIQKLNIKMNYLKYYSHNTKVYYDVKKRLFFSNSKTTDLKLDELIYKMNNPNEK